MKTRIIGAIVALVLAIVGAFSLITYVRGADARAATGAELAEVYVVQETIPKGATGESVAEFVELDSVPERNVAEGAVTDLGELEGLVADADLLQGEQLLEARFIDPLELAARGDVQVPEGMQLVSFTLPVERVVGGAVQAGDEVGMVASLEASEGAGVESRFAFHDVLVTKVQGLAVAADGEQTEQAAGNVIMVTIALSTHDIERWVWAVDGNAERLADARERGDEQWRFIASRSGKRVRVTPYLLVSRSVEFESRLRTLLESSVNIVTGEFLTFGADTVIERFDRKPRIAMLGPLLNYEETHELVEALTGLNPDVGVIVVREQRSDLEEWVDEISPHAVLSPNASDETIVELLERLATWLIENGKAESHDFDIPSQADVPDAALAVLALRESPLVEPAEMSVASDGFGPLIQVAPEEVWDFPPLVAGEPTEAIAVVAPKGGQGKTTLAINLATGLAEVAPNSVVLIDADLQFGDIVTALSLEPERTIVDAIADAAADEIVLKTSLTRHTDGFFVVAGAPSPELGDSIPTHALGRLIERLRGSFRYVIVDTTPGLGEHTLMVLEHVTDAVFVTNMSVPSLRAMRTEFDLLTRSA